MNFKLCNVSRLSTLQQNNAQTMGQKRNPINISSPPHPITSSRPPFVQGNRIRPRYPWHTWRQYPIIVEKCYSASNIWLIKVQVLAKPPFSETVLASDFERIVERQEMKLG